MAQNGMAVLTCPISCTMLYGYEINEWMNEWVTASWHSKEINNVKSYFFWNMIPHSVMKVNWHFGGTGYHLQV
jgi:hypothetical protein